MSIDPTKIFMAVPNYRVDQIIGIHSGSFVVSAPTPGTSPTSASDTFNTGFGDTCLLQGIFSVDSGATWNDFGAFKPDLTTPAQPVLQTVTCQGGVTPAGVLTVFATNYYDNVHSVGAAYTVQYKVVLLAKDTQGTITPLPTNEVLYYSSSFNYQKIFMSGTFANDTGAPTTITHNLGYVPKVRAWGTSTLNTAPFVTGSVYSYDFFGTSNFNVEVNTTTATFDAITGFGTVNISYRVYLDS